VAARPPLSSGDAATSRALGALLRVVATVEAIEVQRFGDLGVTISQLRVMHRLRDSPASCGQVADHLGITASTATALIERMVRRGLVDRGVRPGDRRVIELCLSDRGRRLLEEAGGARRGVIRAGIARLAAEERSALAELLDRLAASVQSGETSPAPAVRATGHHRGGREPGVPGA
jgi:DNA-binding MarR family transcriptional regulator